MTSNRNEEADDFSERLIQVLGQSTFPLSTRELATRLRLRQVRLADYEVSQRLRSMADDGVLLYQKGRWSAVSTPFAETQQPQEHLSFPKLSNETLTLLGKKIPQSGNSAQEDGSPLVEDHGRNTGTDDSSERWGLFKKLLGYYCECIRNEEGADASAFQNQHGQQFIYLRKSGVWFPRPGVAWRTSIPVSNYYSPMLNLLPSGEGSQSLVVGYPVQAYYIEKENEPDVAIIRPVFFFTVEHDLSDGALILKCAEPRPEINLGWLEYSFPRKPEQQRNFLSACGFINRFSPNDEMLGLEKGELAPSLDNLVAALSAFIPQRIREPLEPNHVLGDKLLEPFETGIYNRAVLMLAKRTRYTETLLKELAFIQKMPDEYLDKTALVPIFSRNRGKGEEDEKELNHEAIVADTTRLNAEQRQAAAAMLTRPLTVITGPPGTGKSQVVSGVIQNARLKGQTVIFASRNHKAIDAVMGRLQNDQDRTLIVRTNSKDDPGLKITFSHAIRKMLGDHEDTGAFEKLGRAKEQLRSLLQERGIQAEHARKIEEAATTLGELEDQLSYLSTNLPKMIPPFLDQSPETLSNGTVQKALRLIEKSSNRSSKTRFFLKLSDFLRTCFYWRLFLRAQKMLKNLPPSTEFPSLKGLKANTPEFGVFKNAGKYAQLRIECREHESRIAALPSIEKTTQSVAHISKRISDLSAQASLHDVGARLGVPEGVDREELNGLRAALNAMQTGFAEGKITMTVFRTLAKEIPHILHAFPCWAVTNLSAGSRIPFMPGIFDVAILDEASQCDIPSAIPILFRAKRVGVVGDPFQLTHLSKLSTGKDTILRRKVGMTRVADVRFAYTENSLYDLLAATKNAEPIFLGETYRSAPDIAGYSNAVFYDGCLRIATDLKGLKIPQGMGAGIHWTEISGEVKSGGGSGCYCTREVEAVVEIMRVMLFKNNFQGSVGVVTPFRQQANRLRDALLEGDSHFYDALTRARVHIDTAHGFQGDERDVMVFSLCAGPDMPRGSKSFLRETGNLFNVAVSRARSVMHVVGNRDWAKRCGISHVEKLADKTGMSKTTITKGPWYPHESPWEEKLFDALVAAGLKPRPQFPLTSRRLDMALVGTDNNSLKIDVEVDGDCHRNADGTRKKDDLWRDIQIQGMGWKVMRFWTYQLREDMNGCVNKIMEAWKGND